jgi:hypothetical protein
VLLTGALVAAGWATLAVTAVVQIAELLGTLPHG